MSKPKGAHRCPPAPPGFNPDAEKSSLRPEWSVVDQHHLQRVYKFADFQQALAFTNRVGALAEEQGHHPEICLGWGSVTVQIWTHTADGLTPADFKLARSIDALQ